MKPPPTSDVDAHLDELRGLVRMGKLFDVQKWIARERPIYSPTDRRRNVLGLAVEKGFHSMVDILAAVWPDQETLGWALRQAAYERRTDLVWLLLEQGADMRAVDLGSVAGCYDHDLMRYFLDRWDLVDSEYGLMEIVTAKVRPLIGLIREYAPRIPDYEVQLSAALNEFIDENRLKWVSLAMWMGANPRVPAPYPLGWSDDPEEWKSPMEYAVFQSRPGPLKLMKPCPERDDLNYLLSRVLLSSEEDFEVAEYLLQAGADINNKPDGGSSLLDRLLSPYLRRYRFDGSDVDKLEDWVNRGACLVPRDSYQFNDIRKCIYGLPSYYLKDLLKILARGTEQETLLRLFNTEKMLGLLEYKAAKLREEIHDLYHPKPKKQAITKTPFTLPDQVRFVQAPPRILVDKTTVLTRVELYERVWGKPGPALADEYGIWHSDLTEACMKHRIPLPENRYWAMKEENRRKNRLPLDEPEWNPDIEFRSRRGVPRIEDEHLRSRVEELIERLSMPGLTVEVPKQPETWHRLLDSEADSVGSGAKTRRTPQFARSDSWQAQKGTEEEVLRGYHERAPRVMNALLFFLESQGFELDHAGGGDWRGDFVAIIFERRVPFLLDREGRVLRLYISGCPSEMCSTWRDGRRRYLESCFAQIACVLAYVAALKRPDEYRAMGQCNRIGRPSIPDSRHEYPA